MKVVILFRVNGDYYLLSDGRAVIRVYPELWMAYQDFLSQHQNTFGRPFEYYEDIPPESVPVRPSLCWVKSAKEVRERLVSPNPQLLEIKGDRHSLYGVSTRVKAAARYWRAGRKDAFKWLELEIERKQNNKR